MASYIAKQLAARARRPAVPADVPILTSQITAPGVPDWAAPRPRITKLIAQGRRWCRLTVITAPAGAGKTTALVVWAAAAPGTVAWITVDVCDSRPGVFWAHVVAALRRSGVAVPEALRATHGREAGHLFLLGLAVALAAQDPPVTLGLDYVLRNTGSGLRLVVSVRMDPLPLHRYRLAGS
jgi:LuxR family transcriptional regulator, maltose regulon positive regulatory protein